MILVSYSGFPIILCGSGGRVSNDLLSLCIPYLPSTEAFHVPSPKNPPIVFWTSWGSIRSVSWWSPGSGGWGVWSYGVKSIISGEFVYGSIWFSVRRFPMWQFWSQEYCFPLITHLCFPMTFMCFIILSHYRCLGCLCGGIKLEISLLWWLSRIYYFFILFFLALFVIIWVFMVLFLFLFCVSLSNLLMYSCMPVLAEFILYILLY